VSVAVSVSVCCHVCMSEYILTGSVSILSLRLLRENQKNRETEIESVDVSSLLPTVLCLLFVRVPCYRVCMSQFIYTLKDPVGHVRTSLPTDMLSSQAVQGALMTSL